MLFHFWKQSRKWLLLTKAKISICRLGYTLPNLAKICFHKSTDAELYPFTKGEKKILKKFKKLLLVLHLSFLHEKQFLMKLLFENQQTYANLLLGLTLANYTLNRCVNASRHVFMRVEISIQTRVDLHLNKTGAAALNLWSCPIFKKEDQIVELKPSLQQADRRKVIALVLIGFFLTATLCLNPWVVFTTSIPVKKYVFFSLKRLFNVVPRRDSSMHWDDAIYKRKASRLLKCGSAKAKTVQNNQYC